MVIFSLAIMGVLVLIMVGSSDDDRLGSRYDFEGTRSFYAAESGLANILVNWKTNGYEGMVPTVGKDTVLAWASLSGNSGRYRATIQKVDASTYMVTVDGQTPGARKGLRTVQMMLAPSIVFNYAVLAGSDAKLHAGFTDSFDSDLGTYASQTPTQNGDVFSNGTISQLSESPPLGVIKGDITTVATVGNSIATDCANAARVTGTCSTGASPVQMPDVACPTPAGVWSTLPASPPAPALNR